MESSLLKKVLNQETNAVRQEATPFRARSSHENYGTRLEYQSITPLLYTRLRRSGQVEKVSERMFRAVRMHETTAAA